MSSFTNEELQPGDLVVTGYLTRPSRGMMVVSTKLINDFYVDIVFYILWSGPLDYHTKLCYNRRHRNEDVNQDELDYVMRDGCMIARGGGY